MLLSSLEDPKPSSRRSVRTLHPLACARSLAISPSLSDSSNLVMSTESFKRPVISSIPTLTTRFAILRPSSLMITQTPPATPSGLAPRDLLRSLPSMPRTTPTSTSSGLAPTSSLPTSAYPQLTALPLRALLLGFQRLSMSRRRSQSRLPKKPRSVKRLDVPPLSRLQQTAMTTSLSSLSFSLTFASLRSPSQVTRLPLPTSRRTTTATSTSTSSRPALTYEPVTIRSLSVTATRLR